MIGRQIPFLFLDHADATAFSASVRQLGAEIVAPRSATSQVRRLEWPTPEWLVYLAPSGQVDALAPEYVKEQDCWTLDPMSSPVVEWSVFPEKDGRLRPGRLYHVPRDLEADGWRERPREFLDFASRVRRIAERLAPTTVLASGLRVRVGPSAARRHAEQSLLLAPC